WSFAIEIAAFAASGSRTAIDGIPGTIQHAAKQLFAQAEGGTASPNHDLVPMTDAGGTAQSHGKNGVAAETDNLSGPVLAPRIDDFASLADSAEGAFGLDQLADDLDHSAAPAQRG